MIDFALANEETSRLYALLDWGLLTEEMRKPAGESLLSLKWDSQWDYSTILSPREFTFSVGKTPFADLPVYYYLIETILIALAAYVLTIFALRIFVVVFRPLKLTWFAAVHNLFLCVISAVMFATATLGVYEQYTELGIASLYCSNLTPPTGLIPWSIYVYYLSKFPELIDTFILVLKNKPIIFLHWYHHSIVILMAWTWLTSNFVFGIFGIIFNTAIHILMYYYYFATSLGWKVWYKRYITSAQIIQFISSFVLSLIYVQYHQALKCDGWPVFIFGMTINGTFLLLFIQFYIKTYVLKSPKPITKERKIKHKNQ